MAIPWKQTKAIKKWKERPARHNTTHNNRRFFPSKNALLWKANEVSTIIFTVKIWHGICQTKASSQRKCSRLYIVLVDVYVVKVNKLKSTSSVKVSENGGIFVWLRLILCLLPVIWVLICFHLYRHRTLNSYDLNCFLCKNNIIKSISLFRKVYACFWNEQRNTLLWK